MTGRRHIARAAFIVFFLQGCVVTPEGIQVTLSPIAEPLILKGFAEYRGIAPDFRNPYPDLISVSPDARKGVIVIGRLSAYREFGDEFGTHLYERGYDNYVRSLRRHRRDAQPSLGIEDFRSEFSGWTAVQIYSAPFLGAAYFRALVSADIVDQLKFENPVQSFVAYDSADLVAAETNADGALVMTALLCEEGPAFSACASQYKKGMFDLETGLELTMGLKPKVNTGDLIDPTSYKILRVKD